MSWCADLRTWPSSDRGESPSWTRRRYEAADGCIVSAMDLRAARRVVNASSATEAVTAATVCAGAAQQAAYRQGVARRTDQWLPRAGRPGPAHPTADAGRHRPSARPRVRTGSPWDRAAIAARLATSRTRRRPADPPRAHVRTTTAAGIDARHAALVDLAAALPPAVLAALLGVHITTAIAWSHRAQQDWSSYLAARSKQQGQLKPASPA